MWAKRLLIAASSRGDRSAGDAPAHAVADRAILNSAFEETFRIGEKVVTTAVAEAVLSRQIDDLEPRLTRYGCDVRSTAAEFRIKPANVRLFLQAQLDPARTRELTEQMLVAGLPV